VNGNVKLDQQRAAARSGEWAQHFSNASCYFNCISVVVVCTAVGRTEPNLNDVGLAFDELHISLSELREYVENVEAKPFPYDVVEFPAPKSSCLHPVEQEPTAEATDRKDGLGPSASQTELEGDEHNKRDLISVFVNMSPRPAESVPSPVVLNGDETCCIVHSR